jgi:hypothetical protein
MAVASEVECIVFAAEGLLLAHNKPPTAESRISEISQFRGDLAMQPVEGDTHSEWRQPLEVAGTVMTGNKLGRGT